ncbi:Uncharacterised protein [Vibrio cholerae]|nr:Uncharacterised protein [Vibrio cholerae]
MLSMTASPESAPIWNDLLPNEPFSSLLPPKEVVSAIRFNSSLRADTSS